MRSIILALLVLFGAAISPVPSQTTRAQVLGSPPAEAEPKPAQRQSPAFAQVEAEVNAILRRMEDTWNSGDLEGFLSAYWDSPDVTFFSNGRQVRGRATMASILRQRYAQDMGRIGFGEPHFGLVGSDFAVIWGDWRLELGNGVTRHGVGTAVFRAIQGQWVIVHDHTSFVDAAANPH